MKELYSPYIKEVVKWNNERGLLDKPFNVELQAELLIEEVFETLFKHKKLVKFLTKFTMFMIKALRLIKCLRETDLRKIVDGYEDIRFLSIGAEASAIKSNGYIGINSLCLVIRHNEIEVCKANNLKSNKTNKRGKIQKDINHKEAKISLSLSEVKELK